MAVSVSDIQISKLSADDRLLYDEGLMNSDGTPTTAGIELCKIALFEEKKMEVLKMVKKVTKARV